MRITDLKINNVLGARRIGLRLPTPILLICGRNGAAKSSINESVRMAFSGAGVRAAAKTGKDKYAQLVSEGAKVGRAEVVTDAGRAEFVLPGGAWGLFDGFENGLPDALPYVLDAQRFAQLSAEERRTFLFALTNCAATPAEIQRRLVEDKGCNADKVEQVLPMVHAGFPAACEFAQAEATKAKGAWQAVTGERFGSKKGLDWIAPNPTVDMDMAEAIAADLAQAHKAAGAAQEKLDAARVGIVHHMALFLYQHCKLLNSMELLDDTAPDSLLRAYEAEFGGPIAAGGVLSEDDHYILRDELAKAMHREHELREQHDKNAADIARAKAAAEVTAKAKAHFNDVAEWTAIAEALAPDGLPAELLAQALKPINHLLRAASLTTGWRQPAIDANMNITAEGRPYALHSVSEKWRIDAMIAAAIAHLSGVKILLLDGFDVLEVPDRDKLMIWLDSLAEVGALETAIINATLKAAPAGLPDSITALWVEGGELVHP